jgi:acetyl-CoA carboxylase carboxyl transferase subunit beta
MDISTIAEHASCCFPDDQGMTEHVRGLVDQKGVPADVWLRCDGCGTVLFRKYVVQNLKVCPECDHHFPVSAFERIDQLLDSGTFDERYADLLPGDPLGFNDRRPYTTRVQDEQRRTGLNEAAVVGEGLIQGVPIVFGLTDSRFIMGSMGSVVGEKLTRAIEQATRERLPLLFVSGSGGGARIHEGILSLMQMAKVSAALARHHAKRGLYISVLTHPTLGGVAASFGSLGDIVLAEPGALVGYSAPRLTPRPLGRSVTGRFQTSEFLRDHGFIDRVVHRRDLRNTVSEIISFATSGNVHSVH